MFQAGADTLKETIMNFRKLIYENVEKKHSFHNKRISCHDSCYANIPLYVNKTLPTLENEKEQKKIKFYKNLSGKLIFLWATKNLKMFSFIRLTEQVLKK